MVVWILRLLKDVKIKDGSTSRPRDMLHFVFPTPKRAHHAGMDSIDIYQIHFPSALWPRTRTDRRNGHRIGGPGGGCRCGFHFTLQGLHRNYRKTGEKTVDQHLLIQLCLGMGLTSLTPPPKPYTKADRNSLKRVYVTGMTGLGVRS